MTEDRPRSNDSREHLPDWAGRFGVITEQNWPEYQAKGFHPVPSAFSLAWADRRFGRENVVTGESYDPREGRPLHHKPGYTVYVGPGGWEGDDWEQFSRDYAGEWIGSGDHDQDQSPSDDPATS